MTESDKHKSWTLPLLQKHLQYAVDLELWTIPFYMAAMYSVIDRSSNAFLYIQSIINQEMLHVQLASNVANAFGLSPKFRAPIYHGTAVPHLDFALDEPNPTREFSPYSAEIGPLDAPRLNAMCLIEYPEWRGHHTPDVRDDAREYGSIGEFYDAIEFGAEELARHIAGGRRQVDVFSRWYAQFPQQTVTRDGSAGLAQVKTLIAAIRAQGEGARANVDIEPRFQNTADDPQAQLSHYAKFTSLRAQPDKPQTYALKRPGGDDRELVQILQQHFAELLGALERLFAGDPPADFFACMVKVGADVQNCWKHGVVPKFS